MPRESKANRLARASTLLAKLKALYPDAVCRLDHTPGDALQLLVATILSAQCTDVRVNIVTKTLFETYRTVEDFANVPQADLEQAVRTCGFYRNKAKNIRGTAAKLLADFRGDVPHTMAELLTLPGVARKTANCVLSNAFGLNEGVVVDTHVKRLAGRLRLTAHSDPVKIERDLIPLFPQEDWGLLSHLLIYHGRSVCSARKPDCTHCPIASLCPSAGKA